MIIVSTIVLFILVMAPTLTAFATKNPERHTVLILNLVLSAAADYVLPTTSYYVFGLVLISAFTLSYAEREAV